MIQLGPHLVPFSESGRGGGPLILVSLLSKETGVSPETRQFVIPLSRLLREKNERRADDIVQLVLLSIARVALSLSLSGEIPSWKSSGGKTGR